MFRSVERRISRLEPDQQANVRRIITVGNVAARQAINIVTAGHSGPVLSAIDAAVHAKSIYTYPHRMHVQTAHMQEQLDRRVTHEFGSLQEREARGDNPRDIIREGRRLRDTSVAHIEARRKERKKELRQRRLTRAFVNVTGTAGQVFTDVRAVGLLGGVEGTAQRIAGFFTGKFPTLPEASNIWNSAQFWVSAAVVAAMAGTVSILYQIVRVGEVRASVNALALQEQKIMAYEAAWEKAFRQRHHLTKTDAVIRAVTFPVRALRALKHAFMDGYNGRK